MHPNRARKRPDHTRRPRPTIYYKGITFRPEDGQESINETGHAASTRCIK